MGPSLQRAGRGADTGGGPGLTATAGLRARSGHSPVAPSIRSRSRSASPLWRAYSSIMCVRM